MIAGYKSSQYAYKIYLVSNGQIFWGRVGNGCLEMGIGGWRRVGKHGKFRRGRGAGAGGAPDGRGVMAGWPRWRRGAGVREVWCVSCGWAGSRGMERRWAGRCG